MNNVTEDKVTSKFNAGIKSLERIDELIKDCNETSRMAYLNGYNIEYLKIWIMSIMALYREIASKLTSTERTEVKKLFLLFNRSGKLIITKRTPSGNKNFLDRAAFNRHYHIAHNLETKIRILADKKGILLPNKDEVDEAPDAWDF